MKLKVKLFCLLAGIIVLSGCDDSSEPTLSSQTEQTVEMLTADNTANPSRIDTLWCEGKQFVVSCGTTDSSPQTRGVGAPTGSEGPFDAPTPKLVQKGKYKTYFIKMSEFDWIPNYSYILMRMDKYAFTITLPNNAMQYSVSLKPVTQEGFSTEAGGTKGYTLGNIVKTSKGFQIPVWFYIQSGAAYSVDGKQLCANKEMPIEGSKVKYTYTYNLAN